MLEYWANSYKELKNGISALRNATLAIKTKD